MKLLKFGGSSLGTPERIQNVVELVARRARSDEKLSVVVSAFEGTTNQLITLCEQAAAGDTAYRNGLEQLKERHRSAAKALSPKPQQTLSAVDQLLEDLDNVLHGVSLVREASLRTLDFVMSFGERLSATIITEAFRKHVPNAELLDSRTVVVTDGHFSSALVDRKKTFESIRQYFAAHPSLQIVTGFIGATAKGETTTLGRGGSDYTASLFGAALAVKEIEIWTDVDGVMTADPRRVKKAFPLERMTYEEAMELSHFGAKVIYAPTIQPAMEASIPIRVKNSFHPEFSGTVIGREKPPTNYVVSGISTISNVSLLRIEGTGMLSVAGISKRVFGALAQSRIDIILISQASSGQSICVAVMPQSGAPAKDALEKEFALEIQAGQVNPVMVEKELSVIAVVGENMRHAPGISGRLFFGLGKNGVNVVAIAQGSSELNISVVIPRSDESKALNALHDAFFLSNTKTANLFVVGTGLVGSTFLKQLFEHGPHLRNEQRLDFRVVGLSNSKRMVFDADGIPLENWKGRISQSETPASINRFIEEMEQMNLSNSIFIDCTANEEVASKYLPILQHSISIVTPNKKANSGPLEYYRNLRTAAAKSNVKFYYETNVGAGLPVLNTLNDLLVSGDEILKIEAVLSGTISYIFNNFSRGKTFSSIVSEAKEKGYTEPDPRDDLSGRDVARKLLILAREMGLELEEKDIQVESLVPPLCKDCKSVEDFMKELPKADKDFEARRATAEKDGKVLRYIGTIEQNSAKVQLEPVGQDHPFISLSGSDNIISFTTKRYRERPLVVKGPGAGTDVTAAGIFADVLRVASYLV